ncbi:MAG TPA: thioredoxin domain-containing protein, partial [bacterium]|nr:thioredoxin domain-containing protein [bacterium]
MGDGLVKKHAVILNGDVEARHTENVERAIRALRREGDYRISVLSTQAPKARVDHYVAAEETKLEELISGLKSRIDDDDLLVVYATGHGQSDGEGCIALPKKSCLPFQKLQAELEKLSYGRRIVVMDNCFSGNGLRLFANSKTSVVTQGSPGETVSCQTFSPFFWSEDVKDADGDGKISVQERYAFALDQGRTASLTQFFSPEPVGFSGAIAARPFKTKDGKPVEVKSGAELEAQLEKLKPGQLAVVDFGADWCVPCAAYRPTFENISRESAGKFLMIRAQGVKGSEDDWTQYGIKEFPTVAFIDSNRKVTPVSQIDDPLDSLLLAAL